MTSITVLLEFDFNNCVQIVKKHGRYLSMLLTRDLQKSYLYFKFCLFYVDQRNFIKFSLLMRANNGGKYCRLLKG